jgi:3-oxoadipate enol-lactonase
MQPIMALKMQLLRTAVVRISCTFFSLFHGNIKHHFCLRIASMIGSSDPRWQEAFVQTAKGRIHYAHAGQGEPLVLLHSNGCSLYEFEFVIEELARTHQVFAIDLPGQGDSDPLLCHWTYDMYADAVIAWMDAMGIARASIAGSSIGGVVCLALGQRYAQRLSSLLLVETPIRTGEAWAKRWFTVEGNFAIPLQAFDTVAARIRNISPEFHKRWNIDRSKAGSHTMVDAMWAVREYDTLGALAGLDVPTFAILGSNGPVGDGLEPLEKKIGKTNIAVMQNCGHFPMIEEPQEFVMNVNRFIASLPR